MSIQDTIQDILSTDPSGAANAPERLAPVWEALEDGSIRSATNEGGTWRVNQQVKEIILWAFKAGVLVDLPESGPFAFTDKDTLPLQTLRAESKKRIVPGGSSVRCGSYVAPGVIMMPPSYVNIGAYVDEGTMVDSHALVGSCAQIGKNVHLSAGVQVGGVLEPIGAVPVIIEDNVMVGGNCGVYEGAIIREGCVLGTGVILNGSTPVYDTVRNTVYRKTADAPLEIPAGAVIVGGSRPAKGDYAKEMGLHLYTPVIVKYRDDRTDAATALEEALR